MLPLKPVLIALALTATGATAVHADDAPPPATASLHAEKSRHIYLVGPLLISEPWVDEAGADEASGYLVVENRGDAPDRLTGASLAGASSVSLAAPGSGGTVDGFDVPPNGTLILEPAEAHLVLHGLAGMPPKGVPVEGTLKFERSGSVRVSFLTDRAGSPEPPPAPKPATNLVQP